LNPIAPVVAVESTVAVKSTAVTIRASTEMVWVPPSCPFIQCKSLAVVPVPITHDPMVLGGALPCGLVEYSRDGLGAISIGIQVHEPSRGASRASGYEP
jgi:hypothetical protein